jgi:hypothetical protein
MDTVSVKSFPSEGCHILGCDTEVSDERTATIFRGYFDPISTFLRNVGHLFDNRRQGNEIQLLCYFTILQTSNVLHKKAMDGRSRGHISRLKPFLIESATCSMYGDAEASMEIRCIRITKDFVFKL